MLFNSIDFAIFLPIVFILYWFVTGSNLKLQNLLIVVASYVFYAWWDWRFLTLIIFSTLIDFTVGLKLKDEQNPNNRKILLWTSIVVNLGFLGFFKYYNFFIENFTTAFRFFGASIQPNTLDIILPVGISFYTFQTLSYTIDVYKKKLEPTENIVDFAGFVAFFPQLVAGPIERAKDLLPQFYVKRKFEYKKAVDGSRQILWGLFKKIVIADNCAIYANEIFNNSESYYGITLFLGMLFFTFQIYADFSGYSDIAIGTARLLGFNLTQNFAFPYFSRNFKEFWRRWHISLTLWLRDYLYIPLGGSRGSTYMRLKNILLIFVIVGLWHGANWTFIVFGVVHAILYLPYIFRQKKVSVTNTIGNGNLIPNFKEFMRMLATFILFSLSLIIFRADSLSHAFQYILNMFKHPGSFLLIGIYFKYTNVIILLILFFSAEWLGREDEYAIQKLNNHFNKPIRFIIYYSVLFSIFYFGGAPQKFVYFQF